MEHKYYLYEDVNGEDMKAFNSCYLLVGFIQDNSDKCNHDDDKPVP